MNTRTSVVLALLALGCGESPSEGDGDSSHTGGASASGGNGSGGTGTGATTGNGGSSGSGAGAGGGSSGTGGGTSYPLGPGCSSEGSLANRDDILVCEPWEDDAWYKGNGWSNSSTKSQPYQEVDDSEVEHASVVSDGCFAGHCLRIEIPKGECCGIAFFNVLPDVQQQAYLRYYIKLAPNFDPALIDSTGEITGSGGKMPGLSDIRHYPDEQCGNGGAFPNGLDCWSARSYFRNCYIGEATQTFACSDPAATTRFGHYPYFPPQQGFTDGIWDDIAWGQGDSFGGCSNQGDLMGIGDCGKGSVGQLKNDQWYRIEIFIRMNTPGQEDGAMQGWVDGKPAYDKQNMVWRYPGHDNLHVKEVFLNVHFGGEYVGPTEATYLMLDQLVVARDAQVGEWVKN